MDIGIFRPNHSFSSQIGRILCLEPEKSTFLKDWVNYKLPVPAIIQRTLDVNDFTIDNKCYLFFSRIVEIDHHQRVSLAKLNGDVLNVKVPYEQIKPHTASDLHKPKSSPAVPLEPSFEEIKAEELEEEPCQSTGQTNTVTSENVPKAQLQASKNETNDVVCCGEKKRKKRPIGPLPVTPALKYKDFPKLLPVIESDVENG